MAFIHSGWSFTLAGEKKTRGAGSDAGEGGERVGRAEEDEDEEERRLTLATAVRYVANASSGILT
jgi:hypothetical protein